MSTADRYRRFATVEARGYSPVYDHWCTRISDDGEILALIDGLPLPKRQPNLLLAAARYLGAGTTPYRQFREFLLLHWASIRDVLLARSTQTNEAGRCALILPLLDRISAHENRPLALIEVGASAGLCLYPDRYAYQYDDGPVLRPDAGEAPVLTCATRGNPPLPTELPVITSRVGVDLNPLTVSNDDDVAWLDALIWPEHQERRERLRHATSIVRRDPPRIRRGNLNDELESLVAEAPADAAVVVFHSAVLAYLDRQEREQFRATMDRLIADRSRPCHWISNEGFGTLPELDEPLEQDPNEVPGLFVLKHNGRPVARTGPHGQSLHWLE